MMKLIIRFFLFLFCLTGPVFGIKVATLTDINRPDRILVNKDKIYIVEQATITIYSTENFKFIGAFGKNFIIEVYDNRGEKLFTIKNDKYENLKITGKHIEAVHTFLKTDPRTKRSYEITKTELVFPDYLPAIRDFHADDKKIYIRTFKKKDGKTEFHIYNTEGKFIKKVFVPFIEKDGVQWSNYKILYTVGNEQIYQLVDNIEIEQWELHVHDIK